MPDEFLARRRAEMNAAAARGADIRNNPWMVAAAVVFSIGVFALLIMFGPKPLPQSHWDELDRKRLDCRMMGQSWEHFGSLGWQCVPAETAKP